MSEADDDNSDATEMVSPSDDEELGDIATKPWVWISTHFSLRPRRPRRARTRGGHPARGAGGAGGAPSSCQQRAEPAKLIM